MAASHDESIQLILSSRKALTKLSTDALDKLQNTVPVGAAGIHLHCLSLPSKHLPSLSLQSVQIPASKLKNAMSPSCKAQSVNLNVNLNVRYSSALNACRGWHAS